MILYTVAEVAKMLRVNRNFVYTLINTGKLQAVRVGSIKIRETDLNDYLEKMVIK